MNLDDRHPRCGVSVGVTLYDRHLSNRGIGRQQTIVQRITSNYRYPTPKRPKHFFSGKHIGLPLRWGLVLTKRRVRLALEKFSSRPRRKKFNKEIFRIGQRDFTNQTKAIILSQAYDRKIAERFFENCRKVFQKKS